MAYIRRQNIIFGPDAADPDPSLAELFHENTKLHPGAPVGGRHPTAYSLAETKAMLSVGRRYPLAPRVRLPRSQIGEQSTFETVVQGRRTRRRFSDIPLGLAELSGILSHTAGITGMDRTESGYERPLRASPSAGGLYPAEVYLGVRNVDGVSPGLYHYNVAEHAVEQLRDGDPTRAIAEACYYRESLVEAALVVFFCGVLQRTVRKYGQRGYRYVLLDIGHMAQNLCLSCESQGLACMTLCGFFDDRVHDLFELDGVDETALYVAYVGHRVSS